MIDNTTEAMNLMLAANVLLAGGVLLLIVWARSLFLRLEARFQQLEQRELPDAGDRGLIGALDHRLGQLDERLQRMQFETPRRLETGRPDSQRWGAAIPLRRAHGTSGRRR